VLGKTRDFELSVNATSFFLSRQTVISGRPGGMADWRERLFAWMMHNAQPASDFFRMPPNRVIEIGTQVVI
jgi:KUP system potassium uptake protein